MFEIGVDVAAEISAALATSSGLDDPSRIDAIRSLEELVCAATAAQAALASRSSTESQRAEQAALGVPAAQQGRGVAAQVALARRESHHRGQRHLGLAKVVVTELPHTWRAWRAGRITEWKATLIARETACLSRDDRAAVDAAVAGDPHRLERMGDRELASARPRLPAGGLPARPRVVRLPSPPGGGRPSRLAPARARRDDVAERAAAGEGRRRGEGGAEPRGGECAGCGRPEVPVPARGRHPGRLRARGLRAARAGRGRARPGDDRHRSVRHQRRACPRRRLRPRPRRAGPRDRRGCLLTRRARLDPSAVRRSDVRRARGDGLAGPAVPQLAPSVRHPARPVLPDAVVRRTDPAPRPRLGAGTDPASRPCPRAADGGPTSGDNGQGLCEACNHAKQAPGWRARPSPGAGPHTIETTTPTGHTYRSQAPPVLTIRDYPARPDYVLCGLTPRGLALHATRTPGERLARLR